MRIHGMSEKLIEPGKGGGRAETTRDEIPMDTERSQKAKYWLERAGQTLEPPQSEYIGSCTIHFYKHYELEGAMKYSTVSQLIVSKVEEGLADFGHKEMQRALMKNYGRKVKE